MMGAVDRLYAHDVAMEREAQRLRGLLAIARDALSEAAGEIEDVAAMPVDTSRYTDALRRSDPDAQPESET